MRSIGYSSAFVPPEWIAAHGFRPAWAPLGRAADHAHAGVNRGLCPYAEALLDAALGDCPNFRGHHRAPTRSVGRRGRENGTVPFSGASALVMATTCDQVRHVAALAQTRGSRPLFLINVPATWESPAARQYYCEELRRLGRFLVELGGTPPRDGELESVMRQYDRARGSLRAGAARWPARRLAEAILEYRGGKPPEKRGQSPFAGTALRVLRTNGDCPLFSGDGVPLALVGGPLMPQDFGLFELIERAGGRIVLDASETGERTLPPALPQDALAEHPLETLADAYFLGIPDVFRRPNDRLYEWLAEQMETRGVQGLLLRRYVWCDLWHAEWRRLARWSPVPLLEIDVADDEDSLPGRTLERLEAFIETLRAFVVPPSGGIPPKGGTTNGSSPSLASKLAAAKGDSPIFATTLRVVPAKSGTVPRGTQP